MNVDEDIATYLNTQGIGVFNDEDANIFLGPMRPPKIVSGVTVIPERSCWVNITGGPEPERVFGHAYRFHRTAVQLMIRGQPNQFLNTQLWAQEIWDTLEGSAPTTDYKVIFAQQSQPVFLNFDESERPVFSLNLLVLYDV